MEHRWSMRKPVRLDALILHRQSGLIPATVLDVNLEGVFVTMEFPALPTLSMVELSFALAIGGKRTIQQMEAFVIHHSRKGYGLMFKDFRLGAYQSVKDTRYVAHDGLSATQRHPEPGLPNVTLRHETVILPG